MTTSPGSAHGGPWVTRLRDGEEATLSTSTFKVATSSSTPRGTRTMTLKGVGSGITKTIPVPITVT